MSETLLYLFDDHQARRWAPFTLTRPVGELTFGTMTLRARTEAALDLPCAGQLTRPALAGFDEPGAAPVVPLESVPIDSRRVLLCSRAVVSARVDLDALAPAALEIGGETVGWLLEAGAPNPTDEVLRFPGRHDAGPGQELEGRVLPRVWHLMAENADQIVEDLSDLGGDDTPTGVVRVGTHPLSLHEGAEIEPGVVVDTRAGPVRLESGARVEGPARLIGPLFVDRDSIVFGGSVGSSYIGPVCKVRGEVADTVMYGFSNKAHDGYLGHAVVGRWVNLGALTTNSDLKNNYGSVRVWTLDGERNTGLMKVGCFLGDHVKTGIGTIINSGTVIGAGSNVFGGLLPPAVVPPFSWGAGADLRDYRLDKFLEVAERAMRRRDQELTPGVRGILQRAWRETRMRRAV